MKVPGICRADEQNGLAPQRGEHDFQLRGAESFDLQEPQCGAEGFVQGLDVASAVEPVGESQAPSLDHPPRE